jgi:CheY-like chemotaxis protein
VPKLLLADDSVTIQRVVELTFADEDVTVIAVGDGEQAIARIPTDHPDIVLADIGMPKRSGYDVATFIKKNPELRHIPVLLLAGAFEPVDDARAEQAGCDGVLVKPFEPQHVIARVRELLNGVKGSATQAAAPDVARPIDKLTQADAPETKTQRQDGKPEATPAIPEVPKAGNPDESLDDYFDRLDAAFSNLGSSASTITVDGEEPDLDVPTIDQVLSAPPTAAAAAEPEPPAEAPVVPAANSSGRTVIADAFSALLALEAGEPGARPVRLTTAPEQPVITDAIIEDITRRVLKRLAPDTARSVVVDVVSEIAERLVREEIARIRGRNP